VLSVGGQDLRGQATKLFRKKRYAEACEKYRQASAAAPQDADLLTDLALCQHKLGQDGPAAATNLRAIELAARDAKTLDDPAAIRIRRHAYFNLDQVNADAVAIIAGNDKGTKCEAVRAAPGCARSFHVCGVEGANGFRMRTYTRTMAKVALAPAAARWTADEISDHAFDDPTPRPGPSPSDKPEAVDGDSVIFTARLEDEARTEGCEQTGGDVDQCTAETLANTGSKYECSIVYANACTGLLAVLCLDSEPNDDQPTRFIDEYRFAPNPSGGSR
jgi:tetratricopeptide (TPR) repeat protein